MSLIKRSQPRLVKFTPDINPYCAGSVLAEFGNTKVHITVSKEANVPHWIKGSGKGWITAEYNMLPGATHTRSQRERSKVGGRTQEIQRLIGRSLRSVIDLKKLGEISLIVDCDVIVADGGTRTTSISGAYVAIKRAIAKLIAEGVLTEDPTIVPLAAISVGVDSSGLIIADLNYLEDSSCETDMNVVMTKNGEFIEVQGTAEGRPFSKEQMSALLACAEEALGPVFKEQERVISL